MCVSVFSSVCDDVGKCVRRQQQQCDDDEMYVYAVTFTLAMVNSKKICDDFWPDTITFYIILFCWRAHSVLMMVIFDCVSVVCCTIYYITVYSAHPLYIKKCILRCLLSCLLKCVRARCSHLMCLWGLMCGRLGRAKVPIFYGVIIYYAQREEKLLRYIVSRWSGVRWRS